MSLASGVSCEFCIFIRADFRNLSVKCKTTVLLTWAFSKNIYKRNENWLTNIAYNSVCERQGAVAGEPGTLSSRCIRKQQGQDPKCFTTARRYDTVSCSFNTIRFHWLKHESSRFTATPSTTITRPLYCRVCFL